MLKFPLDSAEIRLTISRGINFFDSFAKYRNLRRVAISGDVSLIPNRTFENCRLLEEVDFSDCRVSLFGKSLFAGCSSLKRIVLPDIALLGEGTLDYPEVSCLKCITGRAINAVPSVFGSQTVAMQDRKIFMIPGVLGSAAERLSLLDLLDTINMNEDECL